MTTRLTASSLANPIIKTVNTTFSAPNPKVIADVDGPFFIALGKTSKGAIATVNLKSIGDAAATKTTLILDGASTDYTFKTKSGAVTISTIANGAQKATVIATLDLTNALDTPFIKFQDLTAKLHAETTKSQAELVIIPSPTFTLTNDTGISGADGITNDGALSVLTQSGSTLAYSLDGGNVYKNAGNSIILPAGKYPAGTIKMAASVNGAVSKVTSNSKEITIDQSVAAPSLTLSNDSGSDPSDGITKIATVNVSGLETGSTWQYTFDGTKFFDGSGASFALPKDALYNKGSIQIRQIDKAGNKSVYGLNNSTWTLDSTAEKLVDFTVMDTDIKGDFTTDTIKFTVNDLENGAKLWYNLDGSNTFLSASDNTFTFTVPSGEYANGKIQLKQTDKAGNESAIAPFYFKWLVNDNNNIATFDLIAQDGVINAEEKASGIAITGDAKAGSKAVLIKIENGIAKPAIVNSDGSWSYDLLPNEIIDSNLTIKATVTDVNGVVNTQSNTIDVIVDTQATAPTFDVIAENDTISPAEKLAGVTISGTTEIGSTVNVTVNNVDALATVVDGVWNYKLPAAQMKEGTLTITATATDKAGNESIAVDKNVTVLAPFGVIAEDGVINAAEKALGVAITGDIKAGSKTVSLQIENGTPKPAILHADGSWSYDLLPSDITGSNLLLKATFTDQYGIVSSETTDVMIDVEASAPTFDSIAEDNSVSVAEKLAGVTISGTTEIGSTVAITVNNVDALATVVDGVWNYKLPAAQMKEGSLKITAIATDKAGNESIAVDKTITVEKTNAISVDINAANTTPYDAGSAILNFFVTQGNYTYNIVNFGAGDQINLPLGSATLKNDSATDRTLDLQYANTVLHLTGLVLTDAQESAIVDINSFNSAFGASSILQ